MADLGTGFLQSLDLQAIQNMPMPRPRPNILSLLDQARQQYPILNNVDLGYTATPRENAGFLEFWPPGETGTPDYQRPPDLPMEKPGLQVFRHDTRPIDILGDVVSHHLVNEDKTLKSYFDNFKASITPEQKQLLRDQYQYAVTNEGETRPLGEWAQSAGIPGLFRGYAFQQWPSETTAKIYTPEQIKMFDEMMGYLRAKQ